MIKQGEIVGYKKDSSFQSVVLESTLNLFAEKSNIKVVKLPRKVNKIATDNSLDSEADKIVNELIKGNVFNLSKYLPTCNNIIKPLALFLDEEILLYAKLMNLRFKVTENKKDKIELFIDSLEQKHPEVKRAIMNSLLELYK